MADLAGTWPLASEESQLVAELREGSEAAFDWLLSRYQAPIYNLVYRLLEDPNDAPDTVQEVFLKVFRGIRGFKGDCSLKTWIYRIAVNEASNQRRWWWRHRRRELSLEAPELSETSGLGDLLAEDAGSPFDQVAASEIRAAVLASLAKLPLAFRTVVILRDMEELSYEEIAEVLQVRVGTVKSRLARGRAALRPTLARFWHTDAPENAAADASVGELVFAGPLQKTRSL